MSKNNLLQNLDRARGLAAEIIELERQAKEKTKVLYEIIGRDVPDDPKTKVPFRGFVQGLPPGWEHATIMEKLRKFCEINADRSFSARELATHIDALDSLGSISSMISRNADKPGESIKRVGKGKYAYRTLTDK